MRDDISTTDCFERPEGASLREALRRARVEAAERTDALLDTRRSEIARLEILEDELAPVFASVPDEIDLFDVGLAPGDRPRLFVDMVAFVEIGRDRRLYRFMRDGRHGRGVMVESERVEPIVEAVTDYVARRLVERERLLVDDDWLARTGRRPTAALAATISEAQPNPETEPAPATALPAPVGRPVEATTAAPPRSRPWLKVLAMLGAFALGGGFGAIVVTALMVAAAKGLLPGIG